MAKLSVAITPDPWGANMRTTLFSIVLISTAFSAVAAFAAPAPDQTLVNLEAKWSKAVAAGDVAAVDAILAPDWTSQGSSGKVETKAKTLADMKSGVDKVASMHNHDVHARVFGDIGVVQGSDDEKSSHMGKDTSGTYTWTDVFQKRGGRWVAVASQNTEVKPEK
jgi:ketosteroid isomerase-like protein